MNALNQIILEGNVVRQPEAKPLPTGTTYCMVPIAVNRGYKSQTGTTEEEVSFFEVDTFGNLAENCAKWCPKGRGIRLVGRLKQNRWKDENGTAHSKIKIVAEHIEFKPFLKKIQDGKEVEAPVNDAAPASAYSGKGGPTKKQKLAMLAEAAAAAQREQEAGDIAF